MSKTIIYNLTVTDNSGKVLHEGSYFNISSFVHELPGIRKQAQELLETEKPLLNPLPKFDQHKQMVPGIPEIK